MYDLGFEILSECLSKVGQRKNSSGWINFNAVCCIHNGETPDKRKRGGLRTTTDGGVVYHCFNCNYATGWSPGKTFSKRMTILLNWFGVDEHTIKKLNLRCLQIRDQFTDLSVSKKEYIVYDFDEKQLPLGAKPFSYWINQPEINPRFLPILSYMDERGEYLLNALDYYWTPHTKSNLDRRVIIPLRWHGKIVGWTARAIFETKLYRYLRESPKNYIFNTESICDTHRFIIVTEGPFDALAVNGVALLGKNISDEQCRWLNNTNKQIIILPDREKHGGRFVDIALREGWFVSFPRWDEGVKDAAQASAMYGHLYTLWSVIKERTKNPLTINTKRKLYLS